VNAEYDTKCPCNALLISFLKGSYASEMSDARWQCPQCNEVLEGQFNECWKCGALRAPEQLLESILLPNNEVAGAYEQTSITTKDEVTEVGRIELVGFGEHPRVEQHVLELTHVARPTVRTEATHRGA